LTPLICRRLPLLTFLDIALTRRRARGVAIPGLRGRSSALPLHARFVARAFTGVLIGRRRLWRATSTALAVARRLIGLLLWLVRSRGLDAGAILVGLLRSAARALLARLILSLRLGLWLRLRLWLRRLARLWLRRGLLVGLLCRLLLRVLRLSTLLALRRLRA
jgi:hypothetical protein